MFLLFRRPEHRIPPLLVALTACSSILPPRPAPVPPSGSSSSATVTTPGPADAWSQATPKLARGMNIGNALDAPQEGAWGVRLSEYHFQAFAEAGFDHVRLPVKFSGHAASRAPYALDEGFLQRIDWAIGQALSRHLAVILDMHHYNELSENPDENAERFVELWKQIGRRYRNQPRAVVLELLNEPHDKLTSDKYNPILARALAAVRSIDPGRLIVVDSVFWAAADKLDQLELPKDDHNVIVSFHMYQPILFTHQGLTDFMPAEYGTKRIVYPGPPAQPVEPVSGARSVPWVAAWFDGYNRKPAAENPCGPATIREQFDLATHFAERTGFPMYMGEFGVGDTADADSRARWLRAVRTEAEKRHIGWAYWDDGSHFKAFDASRGKWIGYLHDALLQ
jgi:endoglucanase